jgi:hypothetical protein
MNDVIQLVFPINEFQNLFVSHTIPGPRSRAGCSAEMLYLACAHHAKTIEDLQQQLMDAHLNNHNLVAAELTMEQDMHTPRASGGYGSVERSLREGSDSMSLDHASESQGGASQRGSGSWNMSRHESSTFEQEQNMECATPRISSGVGVGVEAYDAHVAAVHDSHECSNRDASLDLTLPQNLNVHGGSPQGDEIDGDGRRNGGRMQLSYLSLEAANIMNVEEAGHGLAAQTQAQTGCTGDAEHQGGGHAMEACGNPQAYGGNCQNAGVLDDGDETSEAGAANGRKQCVDTVATDGQRNSWGLGENLRTCALPCMQSFYICKLFL